MMNGKAPKAVSVDHALSDRRILRRNYFLHAVEGGLYMGGLQFVAPQTVLPRMVDVLGGSAWMIALMPVATLMGMSLPGLFVAHRIERLQRVKPMILCTGIFQRVPFLLAALALLHMWQVLPSLTLAFCFAAPLVSGLAGGVAFAAWQELLTKTLPEERRSSVFAIRYIITSVIGLSSGGSIAAILHLVPGAPGYGYLYLCAFLFMALSYLLFTLLVEPPHPPHHNGPPVTLLENLRRMPRALHASYHLPRFVVGHMLSCGFYVMLPFFAIHALHVTGQPDSFLGFLVAAQMIGAVVGNVAAGYCGDRWGGKVPTLGSMVVLLAVCVSAPPCRTDWGFLALFGILGAGMYAWRIGMMTLRLELCPAANRATALSVAGLCFGAAMLVAALLSALLWHWTGSFALLCTVAGLLLAAAGALFIKLREPRKRAPTS